MCWQLVDPPNCIHDIDRDPLWPDNPTPEDLLGFSDIADPVLDALMRERLDPVAVGVFGDWGSGKSAVLEILSERLKARGRVVVVYTRPWEYDPHIDPKATLIAEVLSAVCAEVAKNEGRLAQVADRFAALVSRVQWSKNWSPPFRVGTFYKKHPHVGSLLAVAGALLRVATQRLRRTLTA